MSRTTNVSSGIAKNLFAGQMVGRAGLEPATNGL